jgi:hypothetical protein
LGLYWVPGHAGVRGNEITDEPARGGSVLGFLEPEPAMGVYRRGIIIIIIIRTIIIKLIIIIINLVVGWLTSIGQDDEALTITKDRLQN